MAQLVLSSEINKMSQLSVGFKVAFKRHSERKPTKEGLIMTLMNLFHLNQITLVSELIAIKPKFQQVPHNSIMDLFIYSFTC